MAKKETPELRFTKTEADYIKKQAGLQLAYFEKISKEKTVKPEKSKITKTNAKHSFRKISEAEIRRSKLYYIKADKGRKLLEEDPNFIFGKAGKKYEGMIFEFWSNLMMSNHKKKTKIKTSIVEKLELLLEKLPKPRLTIFRIYYNKM